MSRRLIVVTVLLVALTAYGEGESEITPGAILEGGDPHLGWENRIKALEERVGAIENPNTDGMVFFDSSGEPYYIKAGVRFCLVAGFYYPRYRSGQWEECEPLHPEAEGGWDE